MSFRNRYNSFVNTLAGCMLRLFGRNKGKITSEDLKRADFKTSTQGMGIRFTERIREVFRFKWLKKY
ncbi:MAG: hypothetical protein ACYTBV_20830 [Planctomycetota bacterium]